MKLYLKEKFAGKIFGVIIDENNAVISNKPMDKIDIFVSERENDSCGSSSYDAGELIIAMLRNFLKEGVWQYALRNKSGCILKNISEWPKHSIEQNKIVWRDSSGIMQPIIT